MSLAQKPQTLHGFLLYSSQPSCSAALTAAACALALLTAPLLVLPLNYRRSTEPKSVLTSLLLAGFLTRHCALRHQPSRHFRPSLGALRPSDFRALLLLTSVSGVPSRLTPGYLSPSAPQPCASRRDRCRWCSTVRPPDPRPLLLNNNNTPRSFSFRMFHFLFHKANFWGL